MIEGVHYRNNVRCSETAYMLSRIASEDIAILQAKSDAA